MPFSQERTDLIKAKLKERLEGSSLNDWERSFFTAMVDRFEKEDRPDELKRAVSAILSTVKEVKGKSAEPQADLEEAQEGGLLTRLHRYRERNAALVRRKKASFEKTHGRLYCEACGFDFVKTYGIRNNRPEGGGRDCRRMGLRERDSGWLRNQWPSMAS